MKYDIKDVVITKDSKPAAALTPIDAADVNWCASRLPRRSG